MTLLFAFTFLVGLAFFSASRERLLLRNLMATVCAIAGLFRASRLVLDAGVFVNKIATEPGGHPSSRRLKGTSAVVLLAFSNCVVGYLLKFTVLLIFAVFTVQEKLTTLLCKLILIVFKGLAAYLLELYSNLQKQLKSTFFIFCTLLIIDA